MSKCSRARELMAQALYETLAAGDQAFLDSHLASCRGCAAESREMRETVAIVSARRRPEPAPEFWDGYWDRLVERMERESRAEAAAPDRTARADAPARRTLKDRLGDLLRPVPRWAWQASAAVVLVAAGILIGRGTFGPGAGPAAPGTTVGAASGAASRAAAGAVVPASIEERTARYVERSRVLILGIVNADPAGDPYGLDLPGQKAVSRELLTQAADLKSPRTNPDPRLRELVSELEVILLQIANLESASGRDGVEVIRSGVRDGGLLLKINLGTLGATSPRPRTSAPAPKTDKTTL